MVKIKSLLHIGCGPKRKDQTLPAFQSDDWHEVRLDIDESVAPDILGTMTNMSAVETASMDALQLCTENTWLMKCRYFVIKADVFGLQH